MASVSRSMSLFSYLIHILYPLAIIAMCTVPPDFWCDHPTVTNQCASVQYCQNYKNNVIGHKINLTLYFETHCPDSQLFIVDRLYPRVINDSNMSKLINMDFCPWGMAIRMDSKVCCKHKRDRTCEGNKLISCAMQYLADRKLQMNYIYCFEGYVLLHLPIEYARDTCYKETGVADSLQQMIRVCTDGNEDEDLLKKMQKNTESIFPKRHSLVPWIELNGRSLPEIQVYQLFLAEKLKIWANSNAGPHTQTSTATASKCRTPPDFWCDDDFITNECFDKGKCSAYRANTLGRPIKITVIVSSHCKNSQQFVVDVLFSKVWQNKELRPLVSIHLLPWGSAKRIGTGEVKCQQEPDGCLGDMILACTIHHADKNAFDVIEFVACFMNNVRGGRQSDRALSLCSEYVKIPGSLTEKIRECSKGPLGMELQKANDVTATSIEPEKASRTPWLLINDVSLRSAQEYADIIDRMVCNWYRGPTHERSLCGKCEYEPTSCKDGRPQPVKVTVCH